MPLTYYACPASTPYPRRLLSVKDKIVYRVKALRAAAAGFIVGDVASWVWDTTGRFVPPHTIRARISELVASGDLIRLIDARYAHDEALRQSEREMRRVRRAMGV